MDVGSLFISLGIKGADKTVGALTDVKKGMGDVASSSLAAKAAILGSLYALERLMSASGQAGTNLANFNALTGISTKTLQEYQYAARQVGISNETMSGSIKSVQNVMTAMRLGKGAPEGMALLTGKVGFDANKAKTDTAYVMKKLQEYANSEQEVGLRNFVLKSFGVSEDVIAAMARNAFRPEVLKKAPTYSEKEISQLDKANVGWSNLGTKIQMAIGHFNAMHGGKLVQDISNLTDKVLILISAFIKLAEQLHLFEGLGKIFEGWGMILGGTSKAVSAVSGAVNNPEKRKQLVKETGDFFKGLPSLFTSFEDVNALSKHPKSKEGAAFPTTPTVKLSATASPITPGAISPRPPVPVQSNSTQMNNVNQTFHFQTDGSDHKQVGDAAQKAITRAFFQIPQGGF